MRRPTGERYELVYDNVSNLCTSRIDFEQDIECLFFENWETEPPLSIRDPQLPREVPRKIAPTFYFEQAGAEFEIGLHVREWWKRTCSKFASEPFVSTKNRCNPITGEVGTKIRPESSGRDRLFSVTSKSDGLASLSPPSLRHRLRCLVMFWIAQQGVCDCFSGEVTVGTLPWPAVNQLRHFLLVAPQRLAHLFSGGLTPPLLRGKWSLDAATKKTSLNLIFLNDSSPTTAIVFTSYES